MANYEPKQDTKTKINIRNCVFGFECKKKWDELRQTQVQGIRFCVSCGKNVYEIHDKDALLEAIQLNRCIAINSPECIEVPAAPPRMLLGVPASYQEASDD